MRATSASASGVRPNPEKSRPRFIHIDCRNPKKPACISALMARACARATGSAGHSDGAISAQYSHTASDSQARAPRCSRYGTSPLGDSLLIASVGPGRLKWIITSSTSRPASFTASQPRIDQDE